MPTGLRQIVDHRTGVALVGSLLVGAAYLHRHPFPTDSPPLVLIRYHTLWLFGGLRAA